MHDIEEESDDYSNEDANEKENVNMIQSSRTSKRKATNHNNTKHGGQIGSDHQEYGSFCQFKLKGVLVDLLVEKTSRKSAGGNRIRKASKSPTKMTGGGGAVHKINLNGVGGGSDPKRQHSASAFDLYLEEFLW